jgi:uncharacterized protein
MTIFECIKKGNKSDLITQIKNGCDINQQDHNGMTALMIAVDLINSEIVDILLKNKAKLNLVDKYGQTALMLAAGRNFVHAVKSLLAAKADLKLVSKSRLTALGFAMDNDNRECVVLLKKAGAK